MTTLITAVKETIRQSERSDEGLTLEGLTLEMSAFQSLYGGQFALSTTLINQIFVYHSPTDAAPQLLQKVIPLTLTTAAKKTRKPAGFKRTNS